MFMSFCVLSTYTDTTYLFIKSFSFIVKTTVRITASQQSLAMYIKYMLIYVKYLNEIRELKDNQNRI